MPSIQWQIIFVAILVENASQTAKGVCLQGPSVIGHQTLTQTHR